MGGCVINWGMGNREGQEGRITKWQEKTFGGNGNVYKQDCRDGFTGVLIHQKPNKCVQFILC